MHNEPSTSKTFNNDLKLIKESGIFNLAYYNTQLSIAFTEQEDAINHFLEEGATKLLNPSPFFITAFYFDLYPDVKRASVNPLLHFIKRGGIENRKPNPEFDSKAYNERFNSDRKVNPLTHFIFEFLDKNDQKSFDESLYFDKDFYLKSNNDVKVSGVDPVWHFFNEGWSEFRNPNKLFVTEQYLKNNSEVIKPNTNPFLHYLLYGYKLEPELRGEITKNRIICNVEGYHNEILEGWIFDTNNQNKTLSFQVIQNDKVIGQSIANIYREDLKTSGFGEGNHSFKVHISKYLLNKNFDFEIRLTNAVNEVIINKDSHEKALKEITQFAKGQTLQENPDKRIAIILNSHLFDLEYYNSQLTIQFSDLIEAITHYLNSEEAKNINPNPLFNTSYYLQTNQDVAKAKSNPLVHFIINGNRENRNPSAEFNTLIYKKLYNQNENINTLTHFLFEFVKPNGNKNFDLVLYFDEDFYLKNNPDVKASGISPFRHFINSGWKEERSPNSLLNLAFYKELNQDVSEASLNLYLHFLFYGHQEKRATKSTINLKELKTAFSKNINLKYPEKPIDIILPIFNGLNFIKDLIPQIIENTTIPFRLIIINDCSTDLKVETYLNSIAKKNKHFELINNPTNLGFVKSVNIAFKLVKSHAVILNSDTALPKKWLEKLIQPILNDDKIASVTPMTNAGTIASFPIFNFDNEIFLNQDVETLNEAFNIYNPNYAVDCPTGVGFCMALSSIALNQIGGFDEETFVRGYGEENDWCQRAIEHGFKNVIMPGLFVWHKHGGSFTNSEKQELIKTNTDALVAKHPSYFKQVRYHVNDNPLNSFRFYSFIKACNNHKQLGFKVYITHQLGGGASLYLDKIIQEQSKLAPNLTVSYNFKLQVFELNVSYLYVSYTNYFENENDLFSFLELIEIEEVLYNNIVSYPNQLYFLNKLYAFTKNKKLVIALHDYLPICSSFTLLNSSSSFCGAETDLSLCENCIKKNPHIEDKTISQSNWRNEWEKLLTSSSEVLAFSESSKSLFLKVYPNLNPKKIQVVPHQLPKPINGKPLLSLKKELHVGVVGNILDTHKGLQVIDALLYTFNKNNYGFITVIGNVGNLKNKSERIKSTGTYNAANLPSIIYNSNINVFLFTSVWPETFSFVTDELINMNVPVVCFNIGAPAERVSNYEKGKIISIEANVIEIVSALEELKTNNQDLIYEQSYSKLKSTDLFDSKFYLEQHPDVEEAKMDPYEHFIRFGLKDTFNPSSAFDTAYYLKANNDVFLSGENPLFHYIDHGKSEGRLPVEPFEVNLYRKNIKINPDFRIAVLIHAYYDDLVEELLNYTKNIPINHHILISVVDENGKKAVEGWIKINKAKNITIKTVVNRGRDIAPAFIAFNKEVLKYDLVCKIHTKKSLYTGAEQKLWRKQLIYNLLGSQLIVENIINMFQTDNSTGLVYPISKLLPYWAYTWLSNKEVGRQLQNKIGINMPLNEYIDYPMGSMFWFRPKALIQLLTNKIKLEDFKEEPCGNDGTFAHALERAFVYISNHNGFNHIELNFETNSYAKSKGTKNLEQYFALEQTDLLTKIDSFEVISFDIFDTLIARSYLFPDNIFKSIETALDKTFKKESNFFYLRKKAEIECINKLNKEVSFNEIYAHCFDEKYFTEKEIEFIKKLELELEIRFCKPKPQMIEAFNYAIKKNKTVLLISDMYLNSHQIKLLLNKYYITGYKKLYVSNEINLRKDKGTLWNWAINEKIAEKGKFIHIGDNEHSDIQMTIDRGLDNFHVMSNINLFKNSQIGSTYISKYPNWQNHHFLGPIISTMFNSPLLGINKAEANPMLSSAYNSGYCVYGPIMLSFINWLVEQSNNHGVNDFYFLAREGYFFKEIYEVFTNTKFAKNHSNLPKSHYLLASRRNVLGAVKKDINTLTEIINNNNYQGVLGDLLINRLGVELPSKNKEISSLKISIPEDSDKVIALLTPFLDELNKAAEKERKTFIKYLKSVGFVSNEKKSIVDVGYSGTIQRYLNKITNTPLEGYYFISRDTTKNWVTNNNKTNGYFENNTPKASETPVFKFNLYLEFWLTSPEGQLSKFVESENGVKAIHKKKEKIKSQFEINQQITEGVKQFIIDCDEMVSGNFNLLGLNAETAQYLFSEVVKKDLWDSDTRKIAFLEDEFCGNNSNIDVIGDYKKYVL